MEYLGLYNKPKAVVHPERKLTGQKKKKKKTILNDDLLCLFLLQFFLHDTCLCLSGNSYTL